MKKAEIYTKLDSIDLALEMYDEILKEWSFDILGDDALYKKAKLYDNKLADSKEAKALYERLLLEYPSSIYTAESRKRFRFLRNDDLQINQ